MLPRVGYATRATARHPIEDSRTGASRGVTMDGERRECPIEPDTAVRYFYGEDEDDYLLIAPSHDSINIFPDSRYNHLRYYDADEGQMRTVWLPAHVLADLHDMGIPHTKRDSITECEYEAYQKYLGKLSSDIIEIEEVKESDIEAEWRYYSGEPGWGL
jgi:hypothetical protein